MLTIKDFWIWFKEHEKYFFEIVKNQDNIQEDFFSRLSPQLDNLHSGIFFLVGMADDDQAELVLTPDGEIKFIAFIEEMVNHSPELKRWKFTALKPSIKKIDFGIHTQDLKFNTSNMYFYPFNDSRFPDEIDLVIVHDDYTNDNRDKISFGTHIFLDNYLGEMDYITTIDNLEFDSKENATSELIPMGKLKDYLKWRQKEFIEKYEGIRQNTDNDSYSGFESKLENGNVLVAFMNTEILSWDKKASHPWILTVDFEYLENHRNGMPEKETIDLMNLIEDKIMDQLKDVDGYINIGRETGNNGRMVYFACREFRKPSIILNQIVNEYIGKIEIDYSIYKDKYWRTFNRFQIV